MRKARRSSSSTVVEERIESTRLVVAAPYWSLYAATKSAGLDFARSYAAEAAHRGFRAHFHTPPAMPTSLHARFFPGHDPDALTPCAEAAEGVLALT